MGSKQIKQIDSDTEKGLVVTVGWVGEIGGRHKEAQNKINKITLQHLLLTLTFPFIALFSTATV